MDPEMQEQVKRAKEASDAGFRRDLEQLINRYSRENGSNTPDWILADYLVGCLATYDAAVTAREKWYGRGEAPITRREIDACRNAMDRSPEESGE